jgi:hypothetical protein
MEEKRNAFKVLLGMSEGKILLGGPLYRWKDNIKMGLGEIVWDCRDWIHLAQDIDQCSCECGKESFGYKNCWEILE